MKFEKRKIAQLIFAVMCIYLIMRYWEYLVNGLVIFLDVLTPLIVGAAIAYVVNIVMNFFEVKLLSKVKYKRVISLIMAYGSIILVVVLICVLIVPELKSCVEVLIDSLPSTVDKIEKFVGSNYNKLDFLPKDLELESMNWEETVNSIISAVGTGAGHTVGMLLGYVSSIFSVVVNFVMGLIFSIYILADKEHLNAQTEKLMGTYLSEKLCGKIRYVVNVLNDSFRNFIVGQCIEAVILGTLCVAGMLIFGFPYAVMIGILIGCTALVPIAGAYIGGAVGAVMIFTESPIKALLFIVFLVILQQFEGQIIYPRVVGSSIGLPGIWVFAAVLVGGGLFGIMGILFGIPIVSALYQLISNDMRKRNEVKVQEKDSKDE